MIDSGMAVGLKRALEQECDRVLRLAQALAEIADADYRGNRSPESEIAHKALVAEGLRQERRSS